MAKEERERTEFGIRLRQARLHAKLTQPQLAKASGIAQSTLSELENVGHGTASTTKIAAVCGVRTEWLALGEGPMLPETSGLSPEVTELAAAIDKLTGRQRGLALRVMRDIVEAADEANSTPKDEGGSSVAYDKRRTA
jgi:transcriptional regulator with XRE-family HTH domain